MLGEYGAYPAKGRKATKDEVKMRWRGSDGVYEDLVVVVIAAAVFAAVPLEAAFPTSLDCRDGVVGRSQRFSTACPMYRQLK